MLKELQQGVTWMVHRNFIVQKIKCRAFLGHNNESRPITLMASCHRVKICDEKADMKLSKFPPCCSPIDP